MRGFRSGKFDRGQAPKALRKLCPDRAVASILDVDFQELVAAGKTLVMLDVDNTVLPWGSEDIPDTSRDWITRGKAAGLEFCFISNTRNPERLGRLATALGVRPFNGKFKPSRDMFLEALQEFKATSDQAVMIGDQLFTDVLGANRSGVTAIWVRPMHHREFIGTRANRIAESFVRRKIYHVLEEEDDDLPIVAPTGIFQSRLARQILKFGIVGGSSFVIDAGLHKLFMFGVELRGELLSQKIGRHLFELIHPAAPFRADEAHDLAFTALKVITAGLAILNSFYWNRKWTFGIRGKEERGRQFAKFLAVSLIGMLLNVVVATLVNRAATGSESQRWLVATLVATLLVAVWNFCGQRFFAFRKEASE